MTQSRAGLTLIEVLLAILILLVGLVGCLAALPTGIVSADSVVFQDVSNHLAHSKLAVFRRDCIDPGVDLATGSAYLSAQHEPAAAGEWRNFSKDFDGDNFHDIVRYQWCVEVQSVGNQDAALATNPGYQRPAHGTANLKRLYVVRVFIRAQGTSHETSYAQYMYSYEK
ncbi:MAG TPA: prepilin-type N-terminal cleavage/methylation domain-containing protein [Planctomycetota bacterium]|nr:prepilin-type N-terminal cleavage/methylation domain-containing protein [Planctomycetota bacterium]